MTTKSLYERLGGAKGIAALVDGIVEAHMANPVIQARFLPYRDKPDVVERVKKHTCDFLGSGSGGPEKYVGRSMRDTHQGMNITEAEYAAVAEDIHDTLKKHRIDRQTREDVLGIVQSLRNEIAGI
jgi:hemoglobin